MDNIRLTLAYEGTRFLGWQKTNTGLSVEGILEQVLAKILQHDISLQAASRTDAGVHAAAQVVNFFTSKENVRLDRLQLSLNKLLPKDIAVLSIEKIQSHFHPTLHCLGKEYHYELCYGTAQFPMHRHFSWHYPCSLDISAMTLAAALMEGEHNFSAFCNFRKNIAYKSYVRQIEFIRLIELPGQRLHFEIRGNSFLYKMVRNLVGTLVYVGCGKIHIQEIPALLSGGKRPQAGITAPAHGLCLFRVFY